MKLALRYVSTRVTLSLIVFSLLALVSTGCAVKFNASARSVASETSTTSSTTTTAPTTTTTTSTTTTTTTTTTLPPDHIAIVAGDGQSATVGTAVSTNPKVQVLDSSGAGVAGVDVLFTVLSGGGGVSSATVTTDSSGYASVTFTLGTVAGSNTLKAERNTSALPGTPSTVTFTETGTAAAPSKIAFTAQPVGGSADNNLATQPVVSIEDTNGNLVSSASDTITLSAWTSSDCSTTAATGTFGASTNPLATTSGAATFAGVVYRKAETVFLKASSVSYGTACSSAFTITPGAKAKIVFASSPGGETVKAGVNFTTQPVVAVEDQYDNVLTSDNSTQVAITKVYTDSCTTKAAGTFTATANTVTASNGYATFAGMSYNRAEPIKLRATSTGLTNVCMGSYVTVIANDPYQVVLTGPNFPSNSSCNTYYAATADVYGNRVVAPVGGTPVNYSGTLASAFSTNGCATTSSTASGTILAGASSVGFGFLDATDLEQPVLSAASAGFTTGSFKASVASTVTAGSFKVYGGDNATCIQMNDEVKCWGQQPNGNFGLGNTTTYTTPQTVFPAGSGVVKMALGAQNTCALFNSGKLKCWGAGSNGANGDGSGSDFLAPSGFVQDSVTMTDLTGVTDIAAGQDAECAVVNGGVRCWGNGIWGQMGDGTGDSGAGYYRAHVAIPDGSGVTAVAGRSYTYCAVFSDGSLKCWGFAGDGQLGLAVAPDTCYSSGPCARTPQTIFPAGSAVTAVASSRYSTCAVVNGGVQCWGDDAGGRLGNGAAGSSNTPSVAIAAGSGVTDIKLPPATDGGHACANVAGVMKCWGRNDYGQVGFGDYNAKISPKTVANLPSGVTSMALGTFATCAVVADRALYCWGNNGYFQLGLGTWDIKPNTAQPSISFID